MVSQQSILRNFRKKPGPAPSGRAQDIQHGLRHEGGVPLDARLLADVLPRFEKSAML